MPAFFRYLRWSRSAEQVVQVQTHSPLQTVFKSIKLRSDAHFRTELALGDFFFDMMRTHYLEVKGDLEPVLTPDEFLLLIQRLYSYKYKPGIYSGCECDLNFISAKLDLLRNHVDRSEVAKLLLSGPWGQKRYLTRGETDAAFCFTACLYLDLRSQQVLDYGVFSRSVCLIAAHCVWPAKGVRRAGETHALVRTAFLLFRIASTAAPGFSLTRVIPTRVIPTPVGAWLPKPKQLRKLFGPASPQRPAVLRQPVYDAEKGY